VFFEEQATHIDSQCILRDFDGNDFVFQVENSKAKKVEIKVRAVNDDYSLVDGLNPELPVVLRGQSALKDGVKVRIMEDNTRQ